MSDLIQALTPAKLIDAPALITMCLSFLLNFCITWVICHFFYYPKGRRRDYYFTFMLVSVAIFMMVYLMEDTKMKTGAALGLFAVFGILRYRTESVPIREMTYLFYIVALSVVNACTTDSTLAEKLVANLIFVLVAWGAETVFLQKKEGCKYVKYDNIDLIAPERHAELIADLEKRLGVKVLRVEVGAVDFLKDMCMLHVYYDDKDERLKGVDHILKIKEDNAFD